MTNPPHIGTGPARSIALLLYDNGIGDDIHAMPAVWQKIRDGFDVHVYSKPFTRRCYESIGATWHEMTEPQPGWITANEHRYGRIYSLSQWCTVHEKATDGRPTLTRFEQIAALIEGGLPEVFDWREFLLTGGARHWGSHAVLALDATLNQRSYPHRQTLVRALRADGRMVTELGTLPSQHQCESFEEMLRLIVGASLVVSVDTGPLAVALALGTPVLALFGPSDPDSIVEQFARYRPAMEATVLQSHRLGGCVRPCSFNASNGWQVDGKCDRVAECMRGMMPDVVLETIREML